MKIILTTFNARFSHTAFGLRYIQANLKELESQSEILELELSSQPRRAAELILSENPSIILMGVYIWNVDLCTATVEIIKKVRPEISIIIGGPEVSHQSENLKIVQLADYVTCGEGEVASYELCRKILNGEKPVEKFHSAEVDINEIKLPYKLYSDSDIKNRIIYCETSRGCPYQCEYCMSSIDNKVRYFDLDKLLPEFKKLIERGVRHFKFVDRTFNLDIKHASRVINFFRENYQPGMMLHFEFVPDRLPEQLKAIIEESPDGFFQFEIGIQTLNPEISKRIKRPMNFQKISENLSWLSGQKSAHMHADLIAGLPGENLESFAQGFNQLLGMGPHEIQLGILKKLRGTGISRHDQEWEMAYNPNSPYEILQNSLIDFSDMQKIQRFARHWNLVVNNGNFPNSSKLIWQNSDNVFAEFLIFSEWLFATTKTTAGIALNRLSELLFRYLKDEKKVAEQEVAEKVAKDWLRGSRSDLPPYLRGYDIQIIDLKNGNQTAAKGRDRQSRHHE